ncbi:MAG: undecaprenyldiphospho-muramoylpentapeptide beta-N-acetylglucosaminyltransferase [Lachnospiraceae bacterium]|nr:undecaprenyldiphospho-muramoylpentapeptide beta-N-acetylglucosaminyltransferase [Lachnospiraceae bacterium]
MKILLTGGGTAGHVMPNLALVPELKARGYDIVYVGSYNGMEKGLVEREGIRYLGISSGKLRRYFDWKNFTDPFRVLKGFGEAKKILKAERPDVVFSKGGYVAVPVVRAAKGLHIPVVIHEADLTPGLANKLSLSTATTVCCNFPETLEHLPKDKAVLTGMPIRANLLSGSREAGLARAGFSGEKPVLMIIGGSLGSVAVNKAVRAVLPTLLEKFDVLHLCGRGNLAPELDGTPGYVQQEFANEELADYYAAADVFISRAGANVICELLALGKPNLLIPYPKTASRGDQILNARSFEKQGFSMVLEEEEITEPHILSDRVFALYEDRERYAAAMKGAAQSDGVRVVADLIDSARSGGGKGRKF